MKRIAIIAFFNLAVMGMSFSQTQSIGLRLGEPTAVVYKNYLNYRGTKGTAFEFGLGTASSSWSNGYYRNSFDDRSAYNGYRYTSHRVSGVVYFQGRYLLNYQIPIQGVEGRFDWYWGLGALLKLANVKYYYQNDLPPFQPLTDSRTDIDFGPEGIFGAEYKFERVPITLFAEFSLMLELADRIGARGFVGTGARYMF